MSRDSVVEELNAAGVKRAVRNEPMSRHTSWKIGGPADYLCVVEEEPELHSSIKIAIEHRLPWLVLGGGNNILVSDTGIDGLVILNRLRGIAIEPSSSSDAAGRACLVCGAGVFFARAAQYSARSGYTGMEWGISIPGTVGGGVVNNAGAHWSDVARALLTADVVDDSGHRERLAPDDLAYRYRESSLKTGHIVQSHLVVTGARFRVEPDNPESALQRVEEFRAHRMKTQPIKEASAGSTFKNPEGGHAGALVDEAGLKGHRIGGAQISPLHANFILNVGGASAGDVIDLIQIAQVGVAKAFGVRLDPEIQLVGRWSAEVVRSIWGEAA
jgi:UDP-N-acetylmuramate dehydrogenase